MPEQLHRFFAVTAHLDVSKSIYVVMDGAEDPTQNTGPRAIKIDRIGRSRVGIGEWLAGGSMIAICRMLIAYTPDQYGMMNQLTSFERRVEHVSPEWLGGHSARIVALFFGEKEACECYIQTDLQPCDPRWLEQTKAVLDAIGDDHPVFYVCHQPGMSLLSA